jgi:hypothetical protein
VAGLAQGKTKTQAARDAGYTEATALKQSYRFLNRPLVQSALTEALTRLDMTFEKIVQPIVDGLEATIVLKNTQDLVAKKTTIPDLPVRLQAHDRAVALLAGRPQHGEMPKPSRPPLTVVFQSIPSGNDRRIASPARDAVEIMPTKKLKQVTFISVPSGLEKKS